jgi:hypothetical protein
VLLFREGVPEVRAGSVRVSGKEGRGGKDEWMGSVGRLEAKEKVGKGRSLAKGE